MRRAVAFALLVGGAVSLGVIVVATGSNPSHSDESDSSAFPRQSEFQFCKARARDLPPGFVQRDRTLRNLGNNLMGESVTYGRLGSSVSVHIGYDAVDAAEDLDFQSRGTRLVGRREVEVLAARAVPGVLAAHWEESGLLPPCGDLTLLSTNLGQRELLAVASGVRVSAPAAP